MVHLDFFRGSVATDGVSCSLYFADLRPADQDEFRKKPGCFMPRSGPREALAELVKAPVSLPNDAYFVNIKARFSRLSFRFIR